MVSYTTPPAPSFSPVFLPDSSYFTTTGTLKYKKTGGGNGWNANIASTTAGTSGTATITIQAAEMMFGVSTSNSSTGYPVINWGISVQSGGGLEVYNAGSSGGGLGTTWSVGGELKMVWTTADIKYYYNGTLYKTYSKGSENLYLNCCFNTINSEITVTSWSV